MTALPRYIVVQSPPQAPTGAQIGDQIRESIREAAQQAAQQARAAGQQARDAQQRVRDAQQQLRDAQRRVRDARSADAARDAQAALRDAESALHDAQMESQAFSTVPIVHVDPMPNMQNMIPRQAVDIAIGFFVMCAVIIIGWPLARAFGKRIERRGDEAGGALDAALSSQLQRIEQAVDAMAIEIERISESQRFMAKLQSESSQRSAIPAERR